MARGISPPSFLLSPFNYAWHWRDPLNNVGFWAWRHVHCASRAFTMKGRRNPTQGTGIRSLSPLNSFGVKWEDDDLLQCCLLGKPKRTSLYSVYLDHHYFTNSSSMWVIVPLPKVKKSRKLCSGDFRQWTVNDPPEKNYCRFKTGQALLCLTITALLCASTHSRGRNVWPV